jgi:ABC-type uncharacterized transport system auxiliary subunit
MNKEIGIVLLLILQLSGCFGGTGKTAFIRQYVLEYPSPQREERSAVEAMIRVERFAADRMFMGQAMLYRQGPFLREAYPTHRWRVSPGDMVTEFLRRDLRETGFFRAVLAERDAEEVRFSLTGGVEEFLESGEGASRMALLTATITLLDLSKKETAGLVVFQKTYRLDAAIAGEGAAGLAAGMSQAMADLSRQVIADIVSALRTPGR